MAYPDRELDSYGEVWRIVDHFERLATLRRPPSGLFDATAYQAWLLRQLEGLKGLSESIEETDILDDAIDRVCFASKDDLWREYKLYLQPRENPE